MIFNKNNYKCGFSKYMSGVAARWSRRGDEEEEEVKCEHDHYSLVYL